MAGPVVKAPVQAMFRDWCRAVTPTIKDQLFFTAEATQTPPDRVWASSGGNLDYQTQKKVNGLTACHFDQLKPVKLSSPLKAQPRL